MAEGECLSMGHLCEQMRQEETRNDRNFLFSPDSPQLLPTGYACVKGLEEQMYPKGGGGPSSCHETPGNMCKGCSDMQGLDQRQSP